MLHKVRDLADDLYFDEEWEVRYLVRSRYVVPLGEAGRGASAPGATRLRSSAEVIGFRIEARDGLIGSVADLVVDDETWAITDVVVDSRQWLPGKVLLISPGVIERIDWPARKVRVRLARRDILQAPEVRL